MSELFMELPTGLRETLEEGAATVSRLASTVAAPQVIADYFEQRARGTTVVIDDGRVDKLVEQVTEGAALRLIDGGRTLFGHLGAPSPAEVRKLGLGLAGAAPTSGHPETLRLNDIATARTTVKRPFADKPLSEKIALCRRAERAALAAAPEVGQVRVLYRDGINVKAIAPAGGEPSIEIIEGAYLAVMVTARRGELVQTGYEAAGCTGGWELFNAEQPEKLALNAARRAVRMLDARRATGGVMPVVLSSSAGGTMIHEAVGHGLEADLVRDGLSTYEGQIGQMIASPLITVIDDPTLPGKYGSYAFDDEGTKASPTKLVDAGALKGWLSSKESAEEGQQSSGNGRRESYRHLPIPRMSNTFIAAGKDDPEKIIRDTHSGLFVTRMGGGEVNCASGDFVFEVSEGFLIENGQIGEPVRGCTLAGNGPDVLRSIDKVGSDLGFGIGTCGKDGQGVPVSDAQPTLRIPALTVGGAAGS